MPKSNVEYSIAVSAGATAYLSGTNGAFLAKYDSAGNYIWARQVIQNTNYSFSDNVHLLKVLLNDVYVSGFYRLNPDLDPDRGAGDTLFTNAGNGISTYLSRFSTTGNFRNAYSLGNTADITQVTALEVDDSSNIYMAGMFTGKVDFNLQRGAGDTSFSQSAGTMGNADIFFAKYINDTLSWSRKVGNADVQNLRGLGVNDKHLTIFGAYSGDVLFDPVLPVNLSSQLPASGVYVASYRTAPASSAKQLLTYDFTIPGDTSVIMPSDTVYVVVPSGTNITNLVADFTVSPEAIAFVGTTLQTSGVTSNNFTGIVIYTIMAEDSTTRDYYVKVYVMPTSVLNVDGNKGFAVWPNPASHTIYFERPVDVTLYDINGKMIQSVSKAKELYVGDLIPGVYILKDKQGFQQKLIIQ